MKFLFLTLATAFGIVFFPSCRNAHKYDKYVKELDSLKIVVEQSVANFKTVDSITCYNAYSKQFTYASYINVNLKDTVSRSTANDLQTFYLLGRNMVNYLAMRPVWLTEAQKSINQLSNLSHDLKNGSVEDEEVIEFISEEKKEAEKIISELKENTEAIRIQMEQFTATLPTAEEMVKKLNKDVLPELIKPTIKAQKEMD
jgi:hypothetical protein